MSEHLKYKWALIILNIFINIIKYKTLNIRGFEKV
jgi:hypothetical protein